MHRAPHRTYGPLRARCAAFLCWAGFLLAGSLPAGGADCGVGTAEGTCVVPELDVVDEVLGGAVRLVWSDRHGASAGGYEIERRREGQAGWEAWQPLPAQAAGRTHALDVPGGTGSFEYRIRARRVEGALQEGTQWSMPRAIRVVENCAGLEPLPGRLPRVVASDLDADGRMTGADLERALRECSKLGGCVVELLPVTYDDVAIVISDGDVSACAHERSACITSKFPNGIVIEGYGSASVLRSPLWKSPHQPVAVLELWKRPDVRLTLRNFVLDGRKTEQAAPHPGRNDSNNWFHYGLQVWNQWGDHTRRSRDGCLHNLTVRDFLTRGVSLLDVERWVVEDSIVEDIGCLDGFTNCPELRLPSVSDGGGYDVAGTGILIGWHSDDVVLRRNEIRRSTKYSICLKHGTDGSETSIRRPLIENNRIEQAGIVGIFLGGVEDATLRSNVIDATHVNPELPEHANYHDTFAISCTSRVDRARFEKTSVFNSAGIAVSWSCSGSDNRFDELLIRDSCRQKSPTTCVPGKPEACYLLADFSVMAPAGGDLGIRNGQILGTRCASPISVASPINLLIEGGRFAGGVNARNDISLDDVNVVIKGGARFENVGIEFRGDTRGLVTRSVVATSDGRGRPAYSVEPGTRVVVCPSSRRVCDEYCSRPDAPAWCGE